MWGVKGADWGTLSGGRGDPRDGCGGDRNGFLGEKIFEIGRAVSPVVLPRDGRRQEEGNWVQVTTEQQLGLVWGRWGLPVGAWTAATAGPATEGKGEGLASTL